MFAFDLSQTDDAYKEIPILMEKQMSLPQKFKYLQYQDLFSLPAQGNSYVSKPILADVCPKANQLLRIFQYHRVTKMLVRVDCRPPMGFSQVVKISSSTSDDTTALSRHRKGVTFNLADNPKMYFIVPYSDRDFAKDILEPWCAIILEAITSPVVTILNPTPQYIRMSYEIMNMDLYVDRNVRQLSPLTSGAITFASAGSRPTTAVLATLLVPSDNTYISMNQFSATTTSGSFSFRVGAAEFGAASFTSTNALRSTSTPILLPTGINIISLTVIAGTPLANPNPLSLTFFTDGESPSIIPNALSSIGIYQCSDDDLCEKPDIDFVSLLKNEADIDQSEVKYDVIDLISPPNRKLYKVTCNFKNYSSTKVGIGKAAPKQGTAADVYTQYITGMAEKGSGRYEMEAVFDPSSATPSVAMDTRPPIGQAHVNSPLAMDQTLGTVVNSLDITKKLYVPINTYIITSTTSEVLKIRQHPGNWTSFGQESNAQAEFRPYLFSGPTLCNGIPSYGHYKLTGAGNFQQNFRAVICQAPLEFTSSQVSALSLDQISQLPRVEYFLHGGEVFFTPQWVNRLPSINHRLTDASNTNGWLIIRILENSLAAASTAPQLTLWVNASNVVMSLNTAPVTPPAAAN